MKPKLYCVAFVLPVKPNKVRKCGVVASSVFQGRPLCCRHLNVAKRRAMEQEAARATSPGELEDAP